MAISTTSQLYELYPSKLKPRKKIKTHPCSIDPQVKTNVSQLTQERERDKQQGLNLEWYARILFIDNTLSLLSPMTSNDNVVIPKEEFRRFAFMFSDANLKADDPETMFDKKARVWRNVDDNNITMPAGPWLQLKAHSPSIAKAIIDVQNKEIVKQAIEKRNQSAKKLVAVKDLAATNKTRKRTRDEDEIPKQIERYERIIDYYSDYQNGQKEKKRRRTQ